MAEPVVGWERIIERFPSHWFLRFLPGRSRSFCDLQVVWDTCPCRQNRVSHKAAGRLSEQSMDLRRTHLVGLSAIGQVNPVYRHLGLQRLGDLVGCVTPRRVPICPIRSLFRPTEWTYSRFYLVQVQHAAAALSNILAVGRDREAERFVDVLQRL